MELFYTFLYYNVKLCGIKYDMIAFAEAIFYTPMWRCYNHFSGGSKGQILLVNSFANSLTDQTVLQDLYRIGRYLWEIAYKTRLHSNRALHCFYTDREQLRC